MKTRKIELTFVDEFNDVTANDPHKEVCAVVGYLASWAIGSERYVSVSIFGDAHGDVHANYRNAQGEVTYQIFGQRNIDDGTYSTHS